MAEPREQELKLRLASQEEYDALTKDPSFGEMLDTVLQENHYFDSADLEIARGGAIFRVRRFQDSRLVLGFKAGFEDPERPGFFDSVEVESEISGEIFDAAHSDARALIDSGTPAALAMTKRFPDIELRYLGMLHTRQLGDLLVELDHVTFPGGDEGFEVEVETPEPEVARVTLKAELERRGIPLRAQAQTKLEQFLRQTGAFDVIEASFSEGKREGGESSSPR